MTAPTPSQAVLDLIGRQKAEFDHAAGLRTWVLRIQVTTAALAAASVFVKDDRLLYLVALVGAFLASTWLYVGRKQSESLAHAERLRRATLIAGGLGIQLDGDELFEMANGGGATDAEAQRRIDPDYFASKLAPGPERLSAMTEESAIWTRALARYAARETWLLFAGMIVITVGLLFSSVLFVKLDDWALVARVFFAMLAVVLSTDFLGAAIAYSEATGEMRQIVERLRRHRSSAHPLERLIVIIGDYNAIVGTMPIFPRGLYGRHQERLNRDYNLYLTGAQ